jgi:hypothetical protein
MDGQEMRCLMDDEKLKVTGATITMATITMAATMTMATITMVSTASQPIAQRAAATQEEG